MMKANWSKFGLLGSATVLSLGGCLTVNNIPTKGEPSAAPDGSTNNPEAAQPDSAASGAAPDGAVDPAPPPCENLPDVDYNGIPLKGARDYCAPGLVCTAARVCVPIEPCSATSPAACSLDELAGKAFDDSPNGLSFRPSLAMDDTYVYFTRFGTYGALNEYQKDGAILRAEIGVWEPEVIHENIPAPESLAIKGDSLFFITRTPTGYSYHWASKDGTGSWQTVPTTTTGLIEPVVSFDGTIVFGEAVDANGNAVLRAVRTSGEPVEGFSGPSVRTWPSLYPVRDDGVYFVSNTGHFRLDLASGAATQLDSYVADADFGLQGSDWFALQTDTWLTRRGLAESEPTRIGGIGGHVDWAAVTSNYAFFYARSETLVPRVHGQVLLAVSLSGAPVQQLMDPYVADPTCQGLTPVAASNRGVILRSEACEFNALSAHYAFRPM